MSFERIKGPNGRYTSRPQEICDADIVRFESLVVRSDGCHHWVGEMNQKGYGRFSIFGKRVSAHRFAYERAFGAVSGALVMDHICRNRGCVNPLHLEPVTNKENILRGVSLVADNAAKHECVRGHSLLGERVRVYERNGTKRRICVECERIRSSRRKLELRLMQKNK